MTEFNTADVDAIRADGLGKGLLLGVGWAAPQLPTSTVFADGTTNGFNATTKFWQFNNTIDNQFLYLMISLPDDFNGAYPVDVIITSKLTSVATDDDVTLLLAAYFDAGSDVAPTNTQVNTASLADFTFTIPAASIPDTAKSLLLAIRYDNNLDTADGQISRVAVKYSREVAS